MGLRIGDIMKFNNGNHTEYEVLDIDDSRPVRFTIDGMDFRQDILFKNPEGCLHETCWAGSLEEINRRIVNGGVIILNREELEPRKCGMKKIRL
jgi:hypothetical protein